MRYPGNRQNDTHTTRLLYASWLRPPRHDNYCYLSPLRLAQMDARQYLIWRAMMVHHATTFTQHTAFVSWLRLSQSQCHRYVGNLGCGTTSSLAVATASVPADAPLPQCQGLLHLQTGQPPEAPQVTTKHAGDRYSLPHLFLSGPKNLI